MQLRGVAPMQIIMPHDPLSSQDIEKFIKNVVEPSEGKLLEELAKPLILTEDFQAAKS